jgi:hypothetical protein
MKNDKHISKLIETLTKICLDYGSIQSGKEDLISWVNDCIKTSLDLPTRELKKSFKYNDCSIEYITENLLFSVVKGEQDADGLPTGITYDIAINVRPYFKAFFGVDRIPFLRKAVRLLDEDLNEISYEICDDIDQWCENVEQVFKNLSPHS